MVQLLSRRFTTFGAIRQSSPPASPAARATYEKTELIFDIDASVPQHLERAFEIAQPTTVVNAIGIVKQTEAAKDPIAQISINALLPHQIAAACRRKGRDARLIHFSTDCVFSGQRGPYAEKDTPDPHDLYGRSKLLGEVGDSKCLTIRSSLIGRELRGHSSLVEWVMSQRGGRIKGYTGALYTGFTTSEMSGLVATLITKFPDLDGVWHVASEPIDKYRLIQIVNEKFNLGIDIQPDETFFCDRRLDGRRFAEKTQYLAPPWEKMIEDLRIDPTPY
jgi:dTDP-4-dehydrorhamnose reductase